MDRAVYLHNVSQLAEWYESGKLRFDLPVRRESGQWNLLQKSLLVHSLLADFPIPAICLAKYGGEGSKTVYQVVDGRQRCMAVLSFIRGEYALHACIPAVTVHGVRYVVANKMFGELPKVCRDLAAGFCFMAYVLEDVEDGMAREIFARLNPCVLPMSIRRARKALGRELADWARELAQLPFFQHGVLLTLAQARGECELELLLKSIFLMDVPDKGDGYRDTSMPEVLKYFRHIPGGYPRDRQKEVQCVAEYLSDAFTQRHKFLKRDNVPLVFAIAKLALMNDIEPSAFKAFIDSFASSVCPSCDGEEDGENGGKDAAQRRLLAMAHEFYRYFQIEN